MALVLCSSVNDPGLAALSLKVDSLQSQLQQVKTETETLRRNYRTKCSASLSDATTKLLKLTENVCDADREIIYWYEHGKALQIMLRPLGIKKKTSAIVERRTSRLKNQVVSVEKEFSSASNVCKESLSQVQTLNKRINEYNKTEIGGALSRANNLMSGFDTRKKEVELEITNKELECGRLNSDIAEKEEGIDRLRVSRARAQNARNDATATSVLGFGSGVAILGLSILFPPAGALTAIAAGVGVGSAVAVGGVSAAAAVELDNEADQLLSVQNALSSQLSDLETEIEALRSQLPALTSQRSQYQEVTRSISDLQGECIEMRGGANELSSQLLDDRKRLTGAKMRVDKVAADLRSVEFASTRRQITGQLTEILQDLANVGGATVAMSNRKRLEETRSLIVKLGFSTPKVLMILERAT
ncbi:hypothetical protein BR93DRAFT_968395 [Coniochaeta sp. PMI_546]|nr:hypothetical protein BR93DRAFT_968395 [Coniochaeta sp. PMI_546]